MLTWLGGPGVFPAKAIGYELSESSENQPPELNPAVPQPAVNVYPNQSW